SLTFNRGLILVERGAEARVTFRGQIEPGTGYLVGALDYPGCNDTVLVNDAAGNSNFLANQYAMQKKQQAALAAAASRRQIAPGASPSRPAQAPVQAGQAGQRATTQEPTAP